MGRVSQTSIPCTLMRGGTSKGPFFVASDLPSEEELRDHVLLAVMGSPDVRQIDGIGGADPLTSKVAIVSRSARPGIDVDYLFAQVSIDRPLVDVTPTCGNMLAGVGPFAIERGLVVPRDPVTPVRIYMVNTANVAIAHVPTPSGVATYEGEATIAGVPGTSAAIRIDFLDTAGAVCGALLPTGRSLDELDGMEATLIDNGMPVAVLRAEYFGKSGYETPAELDADKKFKARLEEIRIIVGERMGLGDVRTKVVPDRKSTRLNSSHEWISYAVFCLKQKRFPCPRPRRANRHYRSIPRCMCSAFTSIERRPSGRPCWRARRYTSRRIMQASACRSYGQ